MRRLLAAVLDRRWAVILVFTLALVFAVLRLRDVPLDVLPNFAPGLVSVQTEAPGFDAGQVEQLVTRPIEASMAGTPGIATLRSDSQPGLSIVTLTFVDGVEPVTARQAAAERAADAIPALPAGVGAPRVAPLTSATADVLKLGLVGAGQDPLAFRTYAERQLKPALLAVPGVARVSVFGGSEAEVQVRFDPVKLAAARITLDDATAAVTRALTLRVGGFVETPAQRLDVQASLPATVAEIAGAPVVTRGAQVVTVGDLGTVVDGAAPQVGDALIMGRPGILMTISGAYGANTLAVTHALDAKLADLAPQLAKRGITLYPALHRPANFVETSLVNLRDALALGALFIAVILLLFLRSWRAALISFLTIPVALAAAACALWAVGYAIDTMVLGGFAVALGVLVDDAIIDVENVLRRLREAGGDHAVDRARWFDLVLAASLEIRGAMVYATAVVVLVFVPVLLQTGVAGAFLKPLALAFILSVLASLAVALTLTPALCAVLLRHTHPAKEPRWLVRLASAQRRAIGWASRYRAVALGTTLVLFAVATVFATALPTEFIPQFREGHFVVGMSFAQPGVSLPEARRVGEAVAQRLLALPEVATIEQQLGRAEAGEDPFPVDRSEFHIELKPDPAIDQAAAQAHIRAVMAGFPGLRSEVLTFLGDRLGETLTGETAQGTVQLYGASNESLDRAAAAVVAALKRVAGASDVSSRSDQTVPAFALTVDATAAASLGIDPGAPARVLRAAQQGLPAGALYRPLASVPVVVRLAVADPSAIASLPVVSPVQGLVPFGAVARLDPVEAHPLIRHDGQRRYAVVGFNPAGRSIDAVMTDARAAVARLRLPADIDVEYGGVGAAAARSRTDLAVAAGGALVLIALVLAAAFGRRRHVGLVLLNVPFALLGGLAALVAFQLPLSLGALVGLVTVFGVSARNAILLLSRLEALSAESGGAIDLNMAAHAATERLVPILTTALVAALGLLPLATGLGRAGHELEAPLAIVVLGGLLTSTLLSLVLLPALVARPASPR